MAGDFRDRINVSLQAVAQVLVVCGLGIWLAKRHGLNRQAIAALSGVNWHALMPALMFSSIVGAVTPSNLVLLWPLLLVSLLHIVIGVVPAWLLGWAAKLPRDMLFFTVMAASLPNCGNLPWLFMPAVIKYFTPPHQAAGQIQYMVGLVSVYTIITIVVTLTVPFLFKRPPDTLLLPRRRQSQLDEAASGNIIRAPNVSDAATAEGKGQILQPEPVGVHADSGLALQGTSHMQDSSNRHAVLDQQHLPRHPEQQQKEHLGEHVSVPSGLVLVASHSNLTVGDSCASFEIDEAECDMVLPPAAYGPFTAAAAAPHLQHTPAAAVDSFASHHSSSQLLQHSRQLLGSFTRSFRHSFSRGLRRSNSIVQLVWSFPHGWHRRRPAEGDSVVVATVDVPDGATAADVGSRCCSCLSRGPAGRWVRGCVYYYRVVMAHPAVNLPLGATIAGIACAAVGPVRSVLVNELAPLHWLWLSLAWVGAAAAPLASMQIGAELMQGAPLDNSMHVSRRAQWSATVIAILVKLIIVPLINVALVRRAGLATLVPASDQVYQLLLLVEGAVPAAVTLLVVCGRVYPDIRPLSKILFWQYVASLFTLPAFLVWFMYMLDL